MLPRFGFVVLALLYFVLRSFSSLVFSMRHSISIVWCESEMVVDIGMRSGMLGLEKVGGASSNYVVFPFLRVYNSDLSNP